MSDLIPPPGFVSARSLEEARAQRDEARAEVERLRAACDDYSATIQNFDRRLHEVEAALHRIAFSENVTASDLRSIAWAAIKPENGTERAT